MMKKEILQLIAGTLVLGAALFLRGSDIQVYVFLASYLILGWKVIYSAVRNLLRGDFFNENFLMSIATGGAFIIGEYPEASAVMLFYLVGESFQDMAVYRSRKSISDLMDIRPDFANIRVNGELQRIAPETVKIGDIIVVKPGEKIPLDGVIIEGESMLDTKALTGESVPRSAKPSDTALSGCINLNGVLTIEVTKIFGESTAAKIIDLVENASGKKAPAENFITAFSRYYTPAVVGLAALLAVLPPLLFGGEWADWIHRALVFLVISCPCALVISIPLGFFCGIGAASRNGVLVKGGNYLEALNSLDVIVFDKTGTLTKGVFDVTGIYPVDGFTNDSLLEYAAQAEVFSNHPIAQSILKAYAKDIDKSGLADYQEISGQGTCVTANGSRILAGNGKLMEKEGIAFTENTGAGTRVYVAANGRYAGCIVISDEIKPDSLRAIAALKKQGIKKTVMLTGDDRLIAGTIAKELSIDEVHAQLLPGEKVAKVEELLSRQRPGKKLAFAGDGINDAPVLARADIGIAMGALGSDAAIEAADVVLMTDELTKLVDAIKIAQRTKRIIVQNIVFALGVKGIFLVLGALGISGMWEAVFADTGVSLLAVLNALRIMRVNLQRVR
jgi:Cd2+/Zn2+-exporting ATPase